MVLRGEVEEEELGKDRMPERGKKRVASVLGLMDFVRFCFPFYN